MIERIKSVIQHQIDTIDLRPVGLEVACATAIIVGYFLLWDSVAEFSLAFGDGAVLFLDYKSYYFPTGAAFTQGEMPTQGYLYSSFFALLMALLTLLPADLALIVWGGLQVVFTVSLYVVSAGRLLALGQSGRVLYLILFLTQLPLLHNFKWGQISVLVTLGLLLALVYQRDGRSIAGGLVLALVTSIKYYPAVSLVYFALQRDTRFLAAFTAGMVTFYGLLPGLWLGPSGWWHYTTETFLAFPDLITFVVSAQSQHFLHVAFRWAHDLGNPMTQETYKLLRWISIAVFALHSGFAAWLYRQGPKHGPILATTTLLLALPIVVPSSWPHYYVYLPLCQVALAAILADRTGPLRILLWLPLFLSILGANLCFYIVAFSANSHHYYGTGILAATDLLALIVVYGLAVTLRRK